MTTINRLSWSDRFMLEAVISSYRSPDPNTKVGAAIITPDCKIIANGYNGFPKGIGNHTFSWDRENNDPLKTKYPYVVHAEKNAIHNANQKIHNCTLYVTMYPCNECAKDIILAGIKEVVYLTNKHENTWQVKASKEMFEVLDISVKQYTWNDPNYIKNMFNNIAESL
jgi:dCMP deaminase